MSEHVEIPIIVGRNRHALHANLEDDLVSFRTEEEIFQWHGSYSHWDSIGEAKIDNVEKFCKQLLQLIRKQRKLKK